MNIFFQKPVHHKCIDKYHKDAKNPTQTCDRHQAEIDKKNPFQHSADILSQVDAKQLFFQFPIVFSEKEQDFFPDSHAQDSCPTVFPDAAQRIRHFQTAEIPKSEQNYQKAESGYIFDNFILHPFRQTDGQIPVQPLQKSTALHITNKIDHHFHAKGKRDERRKEYRLKRRFPLPLSVKKHRPAQGKQRRHCQNNAHQQRCDRCYPGIIITVIVQIQSSQIISESQKRFLLFRSHGIYKSSIGRFFLGNRKRFFHFSRIGIPKRIMFRFFSFREQSSVSAVFYRLHSFQKPVRIVSANADILQISRRIIIHQNIIYIFRKKRLLLPVFRHIRQCFDRQHRVF